MFRFGFDSENSAESEHASSCVEWEASVKIPLADISFSFDYAFTTYVSKSGLPIKSIPSHRAVEEAIKQGCESIKASELKHSDLIPGKYEGGMKIWECTGDLVDLISTLDLKWNDLRVLDLGCGAGILGIFAILNGSRVVFQDYNKEVLQLVTGRNVMGNTTELSDENVQFYSGDWASFLELYTQQNPGVKFDVILSSETIYNIENYGKLHDVIHKLLAEQGVCYMAGKSVYFGVGGSMLAFADFIKERNVLNVETCWSHADGVAREIFKIDHKIDGPREENRDRSII